MPHSINSELCEGIALCANACPVNCISQSINPNLRGNKYYYIDFETCIDCGVCFEVCPVKDAVIAEERSDLQKSN